MAEASHLLARELHAGRRFRLLGVGVSDFREADAESQPSLFELG